MLSFKISCVLFLKLLFKYNRFELGNESDYRNCYKGLQVTEQLDIVDATLIFNTIQEINTALDFYVLNVNGLKYAECSCLRAHHGCVLWVHSNFGLWSQGLSNILRNRLHFNFGGLIFKMAESTLIQNH